MHPQDLNAVSIVEIAGGGRPDCSRLAREELGPEMRLKLVNVLRNARLGGVLAVRSSSKRALLVGRDEQTDLPKTFSH